MESTNSRIKLTQSSTSSGRINSEEELKETPREYMTCIHSYLNNVLDTSSFGLVSSINAVTGGNRCQKCLQISWRPTVPTQQQCRNSSRTFVILIISNNTS